MSAVEIISIASNYCTEMIKLNLELISGITDVVLKRKQEQLSDARDQISKQVESFEFDINNDEQLKNYLFDIYKNQLDNDKYGINKRSWLCYE